MRCKSDGYVCYIEKLAWWSHIGPKLVSNKERIKELRNTSHSGFNSISPLSFKRAGNIPSSPADLFGLNFHIAYLNLFLVTIRLASAQSSSKGEKMSVGLGLTFSFLHPGK